MLSTIELRETLHRLFISEVDLIEVYATVDFSFEQDRPVFTILCKDGLDTALFYYKMIVIYPEIKSFYATCNPLDGCLAGNRLLWRKGKWYI